MISRIRNRVATYLSVFARMRWLRRTAITVASAIVLFTLGGFFSVPPLLRHILTGPVAARLHRPVGVGKITFNPYTLRLEVARLQVDAAGAPQPFAAIGHLHARAAWMSLVRLAPVIRELKIDHPSFTIVRNQQGSFNFSDLLESSAATPPPPAGKSQRFAISNIQISNGEIHFADQKLGTHHTVSHLEVDIPFIANLRSDVDIFVRPLLSMEVDGSPFRIFGKTRPFGATQESIANLKLDSLDLKRFAAYVPAAIPMRLAGGKLSVDLTIEFANLYAQRLIRISGTTGLDELDIRDSAGSPLIALAHAGAELNDVQPLSQVAHLGKITVNGLTSFVVLNRDGSINLARLAGHGAAPASSQAQPGMSAPLHLSIASFDLSNSTVKFTDEQINPPAQTTLDNIHLAFTGLELPGHTPLPYTAAANLANGSMAVSGTYNLAQRQGTADITLTNLQLPAVSDFAQPLMAARLASGQLSATSHVSVAVSNGRQALQVQSATASLDNFQLRDAAGTAALLSWAKLSLSTGPIDPAARQAAINEVRADGLAVNVKRAHDGQIDLLAALRPPQASPPGAVAAQPAAPEPESAPAPPPWHYRVASVVLENAQADVQDEQGPTPINLSLSALNLHLKDVSEDLTKPVTLELATKVGPKGSLKISGSATPAPLNAKLRIITERLDLAPAGALVSNRLNATVTGGFLSSNGACEVANRPDGLRLGYRGDVIVGGVRLLDRMTKAPFLRWSALSAQRLDVALGRGRPSVRVAGVALDDFYGRIILNSNGRLNLLDILANPSAPPTSLTSARPATAARTAQSAVPKPAETGGTRPAAANIEVGGVVLQGGSINWTDNFIKPNYSADLSELSGKVGGFGTGSTAPADVGLEGRINRSAPIDIKGAINPLAPTASVDIMAKAEGIGLPSLTPYSTKYTGYPIEKGTLSLDVHYLLKDQRLTADNHIFIDQLTFGNRVESATATNLPVRLAVALLQNAKGEITVDVPISGSLNDPSFSIGQALFHAFTNLIVKAVTAPFTLLASAFGGAGAKSQNLGYVEFQPGLATLSPAAIAKLTTLTKALQDRPGLQLDITGRVDPRLDLEGLRKAMVEQRIRQQKIRALIADGSAENLSQVTVEPGEYDKYLKLAYKAAKFDKPRNFLGLDKSLPPDEMKKLLLDNTHVTDADLRKLAERRADAVRNWLSKEIKPNRLFVVTPKLNADDLKGQADTTRVDLTLD